MVRIRVTAQGTGTVSRVEQTKLRLPQLQAPVLRARRVRFDYDNQPIAVEDVVLPLIRFPGLTASDGDLPDIIELARQQRLRLGRATERISTVPANGEVARHLRIALGADVVKLDRVIETDDGVPIEWRVSFSKMSCETG